MAYVFISYSHANDHDAERIAISLEQWGHEVFYDRDRLPAGQSFDPAIKRNVEQADLFIFLISPDSVREKCYCLTELKFARQKWGSASNCILPVMIVDTPMSDIPLFLTQVATFLQPVGNLAAEVSAEADRLIQKENKERKQRQQPVEQETGALDRTEPDHADVVMRMTDNTGRRTSEPPKYLAFMVNRDDQRDEIRRTIPQPVGGKDDRFIAYVVPGGRDDLHESVMQRYVHHTLPRHLQRPDDSFETAAKTVFWPTANGGAEARLEKLLREILKACQLVYSGRIPDIRTHFCEQFNGRLTSDILPSTLCFDIREENWDAEAEKVFDTLVACLAELNVSQKLILTAFFFIVYSEQKGGLLSFFGKPKSSAARGFVDALSNGRTVEGLPPELAQSTVICLPQLSPVRRMDVEKWATGTVPEVYPLVNKHKLVHTAGNMFKDGEVAIPYGGIFEQIKHALAGAAV